MINTEHPYYYLKPLLQNTPNALFYFSKYVYTPDSVSDEREIIEIASNDISKDWIEKQIQLLRPDQEFALHSKIKIQKNIKHIPMIDFSYDQMSSNQLFDRLNRYIPKITRNMAIYSSGRSFHAYSTTLLSSHKEWIDYMGRLLLVNIATHSDIIDNRWIGHRLIGGYSSLRWSNNSEQYLKMPEKISFP